MKTTILLLSLLLTGIFLYASTPETAPAPAQNPPLPLTADNKEWLDQTAPIMSDYERNAFVNLKTNDDREKFIQAFWEDRDPTPGTKQNEFYDDYQGRLKYVKEFFNREGDLPPWKTEMGKTWLKLGKPNLRHRVPEDAVMVPLELWQYTGVREYGLPETFYVMFFQKNGFGPYRIYSPASDGPEALLKSLPSLIDGNSPDSGKKKQKPDTFTENIPYEALYRIDPEIANVSYSLLPTEGTYSGGVSGTAIASSEVVLGKLENARNYHFEKHEYVERILTGRPNVEVYYSLGPQDVKSDFYWFQSPNGYFMVDYAVQYAPDKFQMGNYNDEYYTSLTLDGSLQTAKDNTVVENINSTHEIKLNKAQFDQIRYSPFQYLGRKLIVPGSYKANIIVHNNLSKAIVPVVDDFTIPDFDSATKPYFTKILLIQSTDHASDAAKVKPFQFGDRILEPLVDHTYTQNATISFFYQLFFPEKALPLNTADLTLEYEVLQNGASIGKKTAPLQEKFDHPQMVSGAISLLESLPIENGSFGPAKVVARLKKGDQVLSESTPAAIEIGPKAAAMPWRLINGIANFDSPVHQFEIALQYMRLNQTEKATEMLEHINGEMPGGLEARLALMNLALKAKQYDKVLELSHDLEIQYPKNRSLLWMLGWTYYGKSQYDDAVRFFERGRMEEPNNVQILNILVDVYQRLSKPDKTLEMIDKSLSLNPQQPELVQMKEKLKGHSSEPKSN